MNKGHDQEPPFIKTREEVFKAFLQDALKLSILLFVRGWQFLRSAI